MQENMEIGEVKRSIQTEKKELAKNRNLGMGWHSFLVNFGMIIGVIQLVYNGLMAFSGMGYIAEGTFENMETVKQVYLYFPNLKILDVAYGITLMVFSIIALNIRTSLKNFRTGAVRDLKHFYLLQMLVIVLRYSAMHFFVVRLERGDIVNATSAILSQLIMFLIQSVYFDKREFLFTE